MLVKAGLRAVRVVCTKTENNKGKYPPSGWAHVLR